MVLKGDTELVLQEKYNFHFSCDTSKKHRFQGSELLQSNRLLELLSLVGAHLQSPNQTVTASLFAKYYSYLVIAGGLFATVHRNVHLDLSLENLSLQTNEDWSPQVMLQKTRLNGTHDSLESLFNCNLKPLFHFLSKIGQIQECVLWAHASYGVHYLFDLWAEEAKTQKDKQHMEQIFSSLIAGMPELDIAFDVIQHPLFPDKILRIRKKCCLRFFLPGASNCTTCPSLSEKERVVSLKAHHGMC